MGKRKRPDPAIAVVVNDPMVNDPMVNDPVVYDPTAPVDGAADVTVAIAAAAAAIAASRGGPTPAPTVTHPRRNAPGIPDGLHPPGTWLEIPGLGTVEIRGIHHRIEYDDRSPQWGNVSGNMWTPAPGVTGTMVGSAMVYPVGSRGRSSRNRDGATREIFYVVRDANGVMHNVGWTRVSRTRPASGPYGMVFANVVPRPAVPDKTIRAVDGAVTV